MRKMTNIYNTTVYLLVIILPVSIICCCIGLCRRYLCNNANKQQTTIVTVAGQVPINSTTPRYVQDEPVPGYLQGPPDYTEVSMPPPSYEEVMKHTTSYDTKHTSGSTNYES